MTVAELINVISYKTDQSSVSNAENAMNNLKSFAAKALGAIGISFSIHGIKNAIQSCVDLNSSVEEMESKFDTVFGNMKDDVNEWAQSYADAVGRNKNDIKTYLSDAQNLLVGFTDGSEESRAAMAEMSENMTELALDLASFGNYNETETINRMTKAVMGESEAAKMLGAVLTDTTRAEAIARRGLEGKYDSLSQLEKMQVNYEAILYQSKDSVGDCEASYDRYESTLRRFNSRLKEIKQTIGGMFMPTAKQLLKIGAKGLELVRNALSWLSKLMDELGGAEDVINVLGIAIGVVIGYLSISKLAGVIATIKKLAASVGFLNKKIGLLFLGVLAIALIVQDFIVFMQGGNSLFGTLLERAGVDCDTLRENITKTWENIKTAVGGIAEGMWEVLSEVFQGIVETISNDLEQLQGILNVIAPGIADFIDKLAKGEVDTEAWKALGENIAAIAIAIADVVIAIKTFTTVLAVVKTITSVFSTIFSVITTIGSVISTVVGVVTGALSAVGGAIGAVVGVITGPVGIVVASVLAVIAVVILLVKNWDKVKAGAAAAIEFLKNVFGTLANWFMQNVITPVVNFFTGLWQSITTIVGNIAQAISDGFNTAISFITALPANALQWGSDIINSLVSGIKAVVGTIYDAVSTGFSAAISFITDLPAKALQWGKDIINNIVNGITSTVNNVKEAVSGVADKIRSFLGFSEPDEGPLSDFHTYMPDMIDLMASGITEGKGKISNALNGLTSDMSLNVKAGASSGSATVKGSDVAAIGNKLSATLSEAKNLTDTVLKAVVSNINSVITYVSSLLEKAPQAVTSIISNIVTSVQSAIDAIRNALSTGLSSAISFMTDLPAKALQWGEDVINSVVTGITSAASNIEAAVSSIAEKIKAYLGFSEPDEGPLSDFHTYMPDMIDLMASGIIAGKEKISAALKYVTDDMSLEVKVGSAAESKLNAALSGAKMLAGTASTSNGKNNIMASTTRSVTNSSSSVKKSVVQNVNISNQFNGDRAGQQKSSKAMSKASSDTTGELARALAFAR